MTSAKKQLKALDTKLEETFQSVKNSFDFSHERIDTIKNSHGNLRYAFEELKSEIETNGVVSDLAKLRKEFDELLRHSVAIMISHDKILGRLESELYKERRLKKPVLTDSMTHYFGVPTNPMVPQEEVTLLGKVNTIVEFLGIELSVSPETVTEAKVKAVKSKSVTKKKAGKR